MVKSPSEIPRNPKFPYLFYGDAYAALVLESRPTTNQEGKDVIEFELNPTDELIKDYKLKINPPREDYVYTVQLPVEFTKQLNCSPHFTRWFHLKTYDGKITPAIKELFNTELLQEIADLKTLIQRKDMEVDVANEERDMIKTNLPEYLKKNVFSVMEQAAPIVQKMMPKEEKK